MAAETEGVGNGDVDVSFYGFIGYIIEAQFFQFVFRFDEVDRRMDLARFDGHGAGNGFDSAGSAEEMAGHGFRRADEHVFGMVAEDAGNGLRFVEVVEVRRRTVSIDVIDVFRLEAGIFDGQSHAFGLLDAFRSRSRDVISVGIAAITADFTVNVSAAFLSMFQFFQEDDAGAFTHDETIAVFIYSGWENTIVTTGLKMLDFIKGNATMEDVIRQLDEDQDSVVNNTPDTITTVTEELSQEDCAMLVGRCFAQATGSDLALVSLSTWIPGNPSEQNHYGVAAKLYAKGITDYDLSVILPTGWNRTIQTVTLTGQQINDLLATGYDAYGNGKGYPYVLVSPVQPDAGKTYQVAICGVSDQLAAEATVTDSGVVGMDAAKAFFGGYTTISRADTAWN